jgi:hypothetical protein
MMILDDIRNYLPREENLGMAQIEHLERLAYKICIRDFSMGIKYPADLRNCQVELKILKKIEF